MKRFHVHVSVDDIEANVHFYSTVFGAPPVVLKSDYAKWMLDDPRINFAISTGARGGIDHLGIQVDSDRRIYRIAASKFLSAQVAALDQPDSACCYARSDRVLDD